MSPKYPRTFHLPWSPGKGSDDKVAKDVSSLLNRNLVITEKLDGSNVCLEKEGCFARSHSGAPTHPSFDQFKALHAAKRTLLCSEEQYFGEWLYAKHSIGYNRLPAYFLLFGIRNLDAISGISLGKPRRVSEWWDWETTEEIAVEIGVPTVPVLWKGQVKNERQLEMLTNQLAAEASAYSREREGVVVRAGDFFADENFSRSVMKLVRKNHIQTDEHWKDQPMVKNGLKL